MRSQRVVHETHSEKVDEMNTDERLGRLEEKVEHLQSDVTEVKTDMREVKSDLRDLREVMHAQGKELREAITAQGASLRAEIHALALGLEKFKWRFWAALAVLFVFQMLVAGGAPAAIVRAIKLP
jgi:uncharacterized protein (UPF0335 family)